MATAATTDGAYRRYTFFEAAPVKAKEIRVEVSAEGAGKVETVPLHNREVTCANAGRGRVVFGDSDGLVYLLQPNFETTRFKAHDGAVHQVWQAAERDVLVTVGDDEGDAEGEVAPYVVKCWSPERRDNQGRPVQRASFPAFGERVLGDPCPITAIAATPDMMALALGLESGSVILFSGNVEKNLATKTQLDPQPESKAPVTGLGFQHLPDQGTVLFAATTDCVATYNLSQNKKERIVDSSGGAAAGLAVVTDTGEGLAVAREDAVHFYGEEEQGSCFVFEGRKDLIGWCSGHLVIVSTKERYAGAEPESAVTVIDLANRLIAYAQPLPLPVNPRLGLLSVWGSVLIFLADGSLLRLTEKELGLKLSTLFRKHLYAVAAGLAENAAVADPHALPVVHKEWGDHLYDKGDLDGAMKHYLKTIGPVQPSHVIRRYLEASQVYRLAEYLQALHEAPGDLAGEGHTTLMLNCFTRMKEKSRLKEILSGDQHFSVEKAIHACMRAGFVEDALELAKAKALHHMYIDIQIQKRHAYREALEYIWGLPFADAERAVQRDGKALAMALPDETTALLKALCTGYSPRAVAEEAGGGGGRGRRSSLTDLPAAGEGAPFSDAEKYMFIFSGNTQSLMEFLEYVVSDAKQRAGRAGQISASVYNTLLELYLQDGSAIQHLKQSFVVTDPHAEGGGGHKAVYVSPNFIARTGYGREQILGEDFSIFQDDTNDANVEPLLDIQEGMRTGRAVHAQITQVHRDGTVTPVLVSAVPIVDREGDQNDSSSGDSNAHVLYYVCVFAELPTVFEDDFPDELVDSLKVRQQDILLIDPNIYGSPVVNVSNEFAVTFLGDRQKAINELIKNSDYLQYLASSSTDKLVISQISEALRLRTQFPNGRLEKDGQVTLVHACPVRDEAGHVPYFVCVHTDISDEDEAVSRSGESRSSTELAQSFPLARAAIARREDCRGKAKDILDDRSAGYSDDHALILCRHYAFAEGLLFLLEKLEFYNDILEYYMEYDAYQDIVAFALKKGGEDPTLWMHVLRYFARKGRAAEMEQVLEILERDKLISPLQVVQLLGEDPEGCNVELVRGFLIRTFTGLATEQAEDEKAIAEHSDESERIRAATIQGECIVKGDEAAKLEARMEQLKENQSSGAALHTEFQAKLDGCSAGLGSAERFATVADYFSFGLFDRIAGSASAAAAADDY
eukprot:SAG22_NODE_898_length_6620_cov_13.916884_2_plen_1193_part_00